MRELVLSQKELEGLIPHLPQSGVILLRGDASSGKTTLVKAWLRTLGVTEGVRSPTFTLMQKYEAGGLEIYHYDLYQIGLEGLLRRGLFENLFEEGLHLVEWGCVRLEEALKKMHLRPFVLEISFMENKRKYKIYE